MKLALTRTPGAYALLFFLWTLLLLSSGRIASSDAGEQLRASLTLALTGHLSTEGAADWGTLWVLAPNGRSYQAHDLGNVVLMLPAAWIGGALSQAKDTEDISEPPVISRVLASLTCAALAAVGCFWLFQLFRLYWEPRAAFVAALAFPATTIFMAYARAAWDVLGACAFMCGVLYYSASMLKGVRPGRSAMLAAATLAAACSFRYSLAPFLGPATVAVFVLSRRALNHRTILASAVLFGSLMGPSFAYNFVRTGSALRPATASDQYLRGPNALTSDVARGLYVVSVSPNRGLFLFSPILLFSLAVPFVWRSIRNDQRKLIACYSAGSLAYTCLIASMANRGGFGWGPRYLVPVLPVIFVMAMIALRHLSADFRPLVRVVIGVSALLTLPPAIVNWHLATTTFDGAVDPHTPRPAQQVAGWRALAWGLQGKPLPVSKASSGDPFRANTGVFPDLLVARVAQHSQAGMAVSALVIATGVMAAGTCARRLLR